MNNHPRHLTGPATALLLWVVAAACGAQTGGQICAKWGTLSVAGGEYTLQNNIWGADTAQCISPVGTTGFKIDSANHSNFGGLPAAYPSIFKGCHWEDCTPDSGMPVRVSDVNDAMLSWSFNTISGDTWNATAEAWFKTNAIPGPPDGAELMLWLDHNGGVQPGGSFTGTVSLAGATWEVWFTDSPGWNFVTYRRQVPASSAALDLKPFIDDARARGYIDPNWYLMDMEAGFEVWQGGAGLQLNAFSFAVNSEPPTGNRPPQAAISATPGAGAAPLAVSFSAAASRDPDGDPLTYSWDFGDGNGATGVTASHTYTTPGSYSASVSVSDGEAAAVATTTVEVAGSGGVSCEYILLNEWNTGFTASIRLTNNGATTVNGWSVGWTYTDGSSIGNLWNASLAGNNPYTATPVSWNSTVNPGQTVEFGFNGNKGTTNAPAPQPAVTGNLCD
ncbi:PKD domain-containing protein [Exilibacterium tricleocarpae]|uniref:PKD domain-containing protein n=1 Tax=Exilibacterium tricleocarpae TaxID=2591008 RepID=A0A545TAF6_9GAMM|nr:cellulose binding domain-containing protein [Exilibacterium tricleocarpae]TQV74202.1 PKD domain-containing protein [Exilibacterium tricleocarpae]